MTLKGIRRESGLSISEVADALGLSERQVWRLEDGSTPVKRLHLLALSVVYGVPVEKLERAAKGGTKR